MSSVAGVINETARGHLRWTIRDLLLRVGLRFVFVYIALFCLVVALLSTLAYEIRYGMALGGAAIQQAFQSVWTPIVSWVGQHLFRIPGFQHPGFFFPAGTGDGQTGTVELLFLASVVAIVAIPWGLKIRGSAQDETLYYWLGIGVRYVLAFQLLQFGMGKLVPNSQFFFPPLESLIKPIGDSSRGTLFWSRMGTSAIYSGFGGALEMLAGLLLLFPRTVLPGALIALAVLGNVFMLNVGFDIPVKVFSAHLVGLAAFLLAPDVPRLINVVLLNRPTQPRRTERPPSARLYRVARNLFKATVILYMVISTVQIRLSIRNRRRAKSPLYGIYEVQEFTQNGAVRPPLTTDRERWRRIVFSTPGTMWVQGMDNGLRFFAADYNSAENTLTIASKDGTRNVMHLSRPNQEWMMLDGRFLNQSLALKLSRIDESKFFLVKSSMSR